MNIIWYYPRNYFVIISSEIILPKMHHKNAMQKYINKEIYKIGMVRERHKYESYVRSAYLLVINGNQSLAGT